MNNPQKDISHHIRENDTVKLGEATEEARSLQRRDLLRGLLTMGAVIVAGVSNPASAEVVPFGTCGGLGQTEPWYGWWADYTCTANPGIGGNQTNFDADCGKAAAQGGGWGTHGDGDCQPGGTVMERDRDADCGISSGGTTMGDSDCGTQVKGTIPGGGYNQDSNCTAASGGSDGDCGLANTGPLDCHMDGGNGSGCG